jgi:hypothetical protein
VSLLDLATHAPDARTLRIRITNAYLVIMLWVGLVHCLPLPRRQGNPERRLGEIMTFYIDSIYIDPIDLVAHREK